VFIFLVFYYYLVCCWSARYFFGGGVVLHCSESVFDLACFGVADSAILYRQRSIPARIALLDCLTLFSVLGHKKSLLHYCMNVETPRKFTAKALPWIWFSFSTTSFFPVYVFIQSSSLFY